MRFLPRIYIIFLLSFYSSAFSLFGVGASSFQSPCSQSSIFTCLSFMYFLITSLHLSFGLPIFRCPRTSICHVLIATSSSVFLSAWPNHLFLASLIFSLLFATRSHLPLLLFLHSCSSQSSLFLSSISRVSFLFFLASFAQHFSVPCSHFHTLEQV